MSSGLEFDVIVAVCDNGGIGYKGAIPWTLHGDMKHFARLTTETVDPSKRNAVVMGRRTWMGIPEANRPLKNRINVVITNTLTNLTSGPNIYAAGSIEDAMALLSSPPLSQDLENIWIIGGRSVYDYAMHSPLLRKVYFTKIVGDFQCDTFFPVDELKKLDSVNDSSVTSDVQTENGISYQFKVYQRKSAGSTEHAP